MPVTQDEVNISSYQKKIYLWLKFFLKNTKAEVFCLLSYDSDILQVKEPKLSLQEYS